MIRSCPKTYLVATSSLIIALACGALFSAPQQREPGNEDRHVMRIGPNGSVTCTLGAHPVDGTFATQARSKRGVQSSSTRFGTIGGGISVNYTGFTQEAQDAFQFAIDILVSQVDLPQTVVVDAVFEPLPGTALGSAGPRIVVPVGAGPALPTPLAKQILDNFQGPAVDIEASFNSSFADWYFGTDANPPFAQFDFVSVVLHELIHGLGFGDTFFQAGSQGAFGIGPNSSPLIFDLFVTDGVGNVLTEDFANPSTDILTAITSGDLFFAGQNAVAGHGGTSPELHAPSPFRLGTSVAHWDESRYPAGDPNSVMTPTITNGEANHAPGPITIGLLNDLGYNAQSTFLVTIPQFGTGGGIGSDIVLVNLSGTQTVDGTVDFFEADGTGLDPANIVTGGTLFSLPPRGSVTFTTINTLGVVTGSAIISANGPVSAVVRFDLTGSGIAGVGSADSLTRAVAPVRRQGSLNTGVAVRNTSEQAITVNLTLKDENGGQVANGSASRQLAVNARISEFIDGLFPNATTAGFRGSICIEVSSGTFAAVAIELEVGRVFTTLPVAPPQ